MRGNSFADLLTVQITRYSGVFGSISFSRTQFFSCVWLSGSKYPKKYRNVDLTRDRFSFIYWASLVLLSFHITLIFVTVGIHTLHPKIMGHGHTV